MRRIKFRVWDKSLKIMHIVGEMGYAEMLNFDENYNIYYENCQEYTVSDHEGANPKNVEYILMQSTGILDKHGTSIFEGDLLRNTSNGKVYKVTWNGSHAAFELVNFENQYKSMFFANIRSFQFEIIGNIYENRELWEGKNESN